MVGGDKETIEGGYEATEGGDKGLKGRRWQRTTIGGDEQLVATMTTVKTTRSVVCTREIEPATFVR